MTAAAAKFFRDMADRIERNPASEFSGAFLIVPPDGDPIADFIVSPKPDGLAFWSLVGAKVQLAAGEYTEARQREHDRQRATGFQHRP